MHSTYHQQQTIGLEAALSMGSGLLAAGHLEAAEVIFSYLILHFPKELRCWNGLRAIFKQRELS